MQSTQDFPFGYFEKYLDKTIFKDLELFYSSYENEDFAHRIKKINKSEHTVKYYLDSYEEEKSKYGVFSFEKRIIQKFKEELLITKRFIELGFQNRFSDKKEVKAYADFLRIKISNVFNNKASKEFPFLLLYYQQLDSLIDQYSKQSTNYSYSPSFVFIADSPEEQFSKINALYKLLNEKPSIITCSKEEFINAFTGKEIDEGINWLITGKNKKFVSKPSLLYFLDELINQGFLSRNIINDLYKFIRYVFRDHKGNELKYLKQSREAMSDNPTSKDRINTIISSL